MYCSTSIQHRAASSREAGNGGLRYVWFNLYSNEQGWFSSRLRLRRQPFFAVAAPTPRMLRSPPLIMYEGRKKWEVDLKKCNEVVPGKRYT